MYDKFYSIYKDETKSTPKLNYDAFIVAMSTILVMAMLSAVIVPLIIITMSPALLPLLAIIAGLSIVTIGIGIVTYRCANQDKAKTHKETQKNTEFIKNLDLLNEFSRDFIMAKSIDNIARIKYMDGNKSESYINNKYVFYSSLLSEDIFQNYKKSKNHLQRSTDDAGSYNRQYKYSIVKGTNDNKDFLCIEKITYNFIDYNKEYQFTHLSKKMLENQPSRTYYEIDNNQLSTIEQKVAENKNKFIQTKWHDQFKKGDQPALSPHKFDNKKFSIILENKNSMTNKELAAKGITL